MMVWTQLMADGSSMVQCPFCERHKKIVLPQIEGLNSGIKIKAKCECGRTFFLGFDKRRHPRKITNLTGGYFHERREYRGLMTIKSLSKSGAGIVLGSERRMLTHDKMILRFNLDDESNTYVEKKAKIKRVEGLEFGLEFIDPLPARDPLLSYLGTA